MNLNKWHSDDVMLQPKSTTIIIIIMSNKHEDDRGHEAQDGEWRNTDGFDDDVRWRHENATQYSEIFERSFLWNYLSMQ